MPGAVDGDELVILDGVVVQLDAGPAHEMERRRQRRRPGDLEVLHRRPRLEPEDHPVAREGEGRIDHAVGEPAPERVRGRPGPQRRAAGRAIGQSLRRLIGDDERPRG